MVALEAGWVVTEVGRQPWIVYGVLRTADAVNPAPGLRYGLLVLIVVYARADRRTVVRAAARLAAAARGAAGRPARRARTSIRMDRTGDMTLADVVLAVMWVGLTAYALFGGADFGGGSGTCWPAAPDGRAAARASSSTPSARCGRPTTSG